MRKSESAGQARFRKWVLVVCGIALSVFFIKELMGIVHTPMPWKLKVCIGAVFLGFPGTAFAGALAHVHEAKTLEREEKENEQDVP